VTLFELEVLLTINKITVPLTMEFHATQAAIAGLKDKGFIDPAPDLPSRFIVSIKGSQYLSKLIRPNGQIERAKGLLEFAAGRLVEIHGENPDVDYVLGMRAGRL
jgi:hypothetical protein